MNFLLVTVLSMCQFSYPSSQGAGKCEVNNNEELFVSVSDVRSMSRYKYISCSEFSSGKSTEDRVYSKCKKSISVGCELVTKDGVIHNTIESCGKFKKVSL